MPVRTNALIVLALMMHTMLFSFDSRVANASCADQAHGVCHDQLSRLDSVVWSGNMFVAVGVVREPNAPHQSSALVKLSNDGTIQQLVILKLPKLPNGIRRNDIVSIWPQKIITMPAGALAIFGRIKVSKDGKQIDLAWATKVTEDLKVAWTKVFGDGSSASQIFHSGYYDVSSDQIVAVGRRQRGSDRGLSCENWSQGLLFTLDANDGKRIDALFSGKKTPRYKNRRAIFDILLSEDGKSAIVTGFSSRPHLTKRNKCQDHAFLASFLRNGGGNWKELATQLLGSKKVPYVGFSIAKIDETKVIVAGSGSDIQLDVPAAMVAVIQADILKPVRNRAFPFPANGSDGEGGDRFRTIIQSPDQKGFIVAGTGSKSKAAKNQAWWRRLDTNLESIGDGQVITGFAGSDIREIAASEDGTVMAVGRVYSGKYFGWAQPIVKGADASQLFSSRRTLDSTLSRLATFALGPGEFNVGVLGPTGFEIFDKNLKVGSQRELGFQLEESGFVRFIARPAKGDLDLTIVDDKKRLIEFSDFDANATEFIQTHLSAGKYTLILTAISEVPAFEIYGAIVSSKLDDELKQLHGLDREMRIQLAEKLKQNGYTITNKPDIALADEALRALHAASYAAKLPLDISKIAKSLPSQ